ncbi:MAG: ice-binding family protein [Pyrinomonadaceae bacterium]
MGNKGIVDNGYSKVGGDVGVGAGAQIRGLRSDNVKGMLRSGEGAEKVQKDFAGAFKFINYLPCTEVADTNLGGKTFTPGVYCLSSADLAGQVILNSDDANGIFIFKVNGSLTTQSGSGMQLTERGESLQCFLYH